MNMEVCNMLSDAYKLEIYNFTKIQGGWSALAYRLDTDGGKIFLKVYDKNRPTTKDCIERIEYYMPILSILNENEDLRKHIVYPRLTPDGSYIYEDNEHIYMLFNFIDGQTIAEQKLSNVQRKDLAYIIAKLHESEQNIYNIPQCLKEDFDIKFTEKLHMIVSNKDMYKDLYNAWKPYEHKLYKNIDHIQNLTQQLSILEHEFVICHTDIHGWNLMQADNLILIDWEGLRFAPAEADLFSFSESFFYDYASAEFFEAYHKFRPNYIINDKLMDFYRVRRRLEDIYDFAARLIYDNISDKERISVLNYLVKECMYI